MAMRMRVGVRSLLTAGGATVCLAVAAIFCALSAGGDESTARHSQDSGPAAHRFIDPHRLLGKGREASFCFAPGTPVDVVEHYSDLISPQPDGDVGMFFVTTSRWSGSLGSPRALTWSFIPDGVSVDGETSELFSRMDALFASAGGRQVWIALFEDSFARWAAMSGTSYTRITYNGNDWDDGAPFGDVGAATRGDIRISMIVQDGSSNVLAYNYFPSQGGDMVLDRAENWASSSGNYIFLRNVLMHEHGHGLGLRHCCPANQTKLMEPFLNTGFDGPQHDDIRGVHSLYGDDFENNNTAGAASDIGQLAAGVPLVLGQVPGAAVLNGSLLSIDANGENDWFRFSVSGTTALDCTLTPVGLNYDSSTQNGDGSCNSGSFVDSLTIANLNIQVVGSDGSDVLATGASASAGAAEVLTDVVLPQAGNYYLRVYESGAPFAPQLYRITLLAADLDCNNNGINDPLELANGTSTDCNDNQILDECEVTPENDLDNDLLPDACEYRYGDLDLDGDVDQTDFGLMQTCLLGSLAQQTSPECLKADLDSDTHVDADDLARLLGCVSGAMVPFDPGCLD